MDFGNNTAIKAYFEIGPWKNISLSPTMRMVFEDNSYIGMGARGAYYFDSLLKLADPWDVYAGMDMTFNFDGPDSFHLNGHMGVEYIFGSHRRNC